MGLRATILSQILLGKVHELERMIDSRQERGKRRGWARVIIVQDMKVRGGCPDGSTNQICICGIVHV